MSNTETQAHKTVTTTLSKLREKRACIDGYNKIACHVSGIEFDCDADEWVVTDHSSPITLSEILSVNDFADALWALRAVDQTPSVVRAERLFSVWCARQVQHLLTDERSIAAIDVAERHANGTATDDELGAAWDAAWAASAAAWAASDATSDAASDAAVRAAAWAASDDASDAASGAAVRAAAWAAPATWAAQKEMFKAVFCGDSINIDVMYSEVAK